MTLFEYLAIAFSLVFSFSAVRLVSGLPYALEGGRRYFVHSLHIANLLFATAAVFWAFWSFREVDWNYIRFLFALASPALLYFLACTLIPEAASTVSSWRDHFFRVRQRYFLGLAAWALVIAFNSTFTRGMPLDHPARILQVDVIGVSILGAASSRPSLHAVIAASGPVLLIFQGAIYFFPGGTGGF